MFQNYTMCYFAGNMFYVYCLDGKEVTAETCATCGLYTKNPLVEMGILSPVSELPLGEKRKSTKRLVEGRLLTSDQHDHALVFGEARTE